MGGRVSRIDCSVDNCVVHPVSLRIGHAAERSAVEKKVEKKIPSSLCLDLDGLDVLGKVVRPLLEWSGLGDSLGPEVRGEECVRVLEGLEGGLHEVTLGSGVSGGAGEAIGDSCKHEHLLQSGGSNDSGSTRGRNESDRDGTRFSGELHGHGVGGTKLVSPVSTTHRDEAELGGDDSSSDGSGDLLGALVSETDVAVVVTNQYVGNESVGLTGGAHLLNGVNLHDVILQLSSGVEGVNDLVFLNGEGVEVDLFNGIDLSILNQSSELGYGDPFLVLALLSFFALLSLLSSLESSFSEGSLSFVTSLFTFFATHSLL